MRTIKSAVDKVAEIAERAKQRNAERKPLPAKKADVIQLPIWPEPVRPVPNGMLRSALFGVVKPGPRRFLRDEPVFAQTGVTIRYTGERLDQADLDVWLSVLHVMRAQELGAACTFSAYQLLQLLGQTACGKNRQTLHTRLKRLREASIEYTDGKWWYSGSLVNEVLKDEANGQYFCTLSPAIIKLLQGDAFTLLDWVVRQSLGGKQLALWLHGYYASHAKPFPVGIETLHKLCGSEAVQLSEFRKSVRLALAAVVSASKETGQSFEWSITNDLVRVKRIGTASQRRSVARKRQAKKQDKKSPE